MPEANVAKVFNKIDVFKGLSRDQLIELNTWLLRREFPAGVMVFREGQLPNGLYVLAQGTVAAVKSTGYRKLILATLEAPDFFGEMGLLNGAERSAGIRAETDVVVGLLPTDLFESKLEADNLTAFRIALNIGRLVSQRLRMMNKRVTAQSVIIQKRSGVKTS